MSNTDDLTLEQAIDDFRKLALALARMMPATAASQRRSTGD